MASNKISFSKFTIGAGLSVLLILAVGGVVFGRQFLVKDPAGTQVSQASSPSPSPTAQFYRFTSQKYNYSLRIPQGWGKLDFVEVKQIEYAYKNSTPGAETITDEQKRLMDDYYLLMDAGFSDYQTPEGFRPRILIRVDPSGMTLQEAMHDYKEFLDSALPELTYMKEGAQKFQKQDAYLIEMREQVSPVTRYVRYAKVILFKRNNLIFTIALRGPEDGWQEKYGKLFDEIVNSFTIK